MFNSPFKFMVTAWQPSIGENLDICHITWIDNGSGIKLYETIFINKKLDKETHGKQMIEMEIETFTAKLLALRDSLNRVCGR